MSKTPEEIKKGLRRFATELDDIVAFCNVEETGGLLEEARNRMFEAATCIEEMDSDLSAWGDVASSPGAVEDMARENYMLTERLAQVERERDAAVKCITQVCEAINAPVRRISDTNNNLMNAKRSILHWVANWRGVFEENTKEEEK